MGAQKQVSPKMPKFFRVMALFALLVALTFLSFGGPAGDSLGIEVLLTKQICIDNGVNGRFIGSFAITPQRHILLSTPEKLYSLGWGGLVPFKKNVPVNLYSFAYTPDGFLMGVRSGELVIFDAQANIVKLYNLPEKDMKIAAGNYVMYLYDCNNAKSRHTLFAIARGGKFARLLELATPIESVVETGSSILFAAGSTIFHFTPKSNELKAIATLPGNRRIRSIAADPLNDRIFFSSGNSVFALKGTSPVVITNSTGGELKYYKNGLIIFNPERSLLLRVTGIEAGIAAVDERKKAIPEAKPADEILTNKTIGDMVKSGLSDKSIIEAINRSRVDFDLSVDSMVALSGQNVSSAVIMAMKQAKKKQTAKTP